MAHGPDCARTFNSMRTHSPKNLAIRAIRKLRLKSRTGAGLLSSMFEKGDLLFFHFYYPPAGQSGEYFRWTELMHSFDETCRLQVIMSRSRHDPFLQRHQHPEAATQAPRMPSGQRKHTSIHRGRQANNRKDTRNCRSAGLDVKAIMNTFSTQLA